MNRPIADEELARYGEIEQQEMARHRKLTDELELRLVEVENARADRRYALGDEEARRVRALNWNPRS